MRIFSNSHIRACIFVFGASISLASKVAVSQVDEGEAHRRAEQIVKKMSVEDKIDLLSGASLFDTKAMPKYGIPSLLMTDGPAGARLPPPSTAYAAGIGLAATWDQNVAQEVGVQLARDAKSRGANFLLGPGVNLYRAPMNGRNYEYFGEDPLLASRIAVAYIRGVQSQNVSATIKHFAGNNSEFARMTSNSVIDEHALRELYLPTFEAAVKEANVGAVMDSYNKLNGEYATANPFLNQKVLREDWHFQGLLMSDWSATHDGVAVANAGLDLEMPNGVFMNKATLLPALKDGKISMEEIDRKVEHFLYTAARFGWLDHPILDTSIPRLNLQGAAAALQGARESIVLLKNEKNLLPLDAKKIKRIAVIGPDAYPAIPTAGGSGDVPVFQQTSLLTGLAQQLDGQAIVTYAAGLRSLSFLSGATAFHPTPGSTTHGVTVTAYTDKEMTGTPSSTQTQYSMSAGTPMFTGTALLNMINNFTLPQIGAMLVQKDTHSYRWTGYLNANGEDAYTVFVQHPGSFRLLVDGELVFDQSHIHRYSFNQKQMVLSRGEHKFELELYGWDDFGALFFRAGAVPTRSLVQQDAVQLAKEADVVVLGLGFQPDTESESMDRPFGLPPGQDELVRQIVAVNPNVVATITSGGAVDVAPWVNTVPALLQLWYPGQDGGRAFAEIVTGKVNPSGRLPISWDKALSDNPSIDNYYYNDAAKPDDIVYREGVFTGYRGYEHAGKQPLFPFGYGLSYTTFAHRSASAVLDKQSVVVKVRVKNSGSRDGAVVSQIYVAPPAGSLPEEPIKTLAGFARTELKAGEEKEVSVTLPLRALLHFDVASHLWTGAAGDYTVLVGQSSSQIDQRCTLHVPQAMQEKVSQ